MDFIRYILILVVFSVESYAGGHDECQHDHVRLHVPEFIEHDHHTKVITIHHHHHQPKTDHHHHHHHHKPHVIHGPPKYHYNHHHSKSSSHALSKGVRITDLGKKSLGKHGHHGHHGKRGHFHSAHKAHQSHKHYEPPTSYDPPASHDQSPSYDPPSVNYAPPTINYSPSLSYGNDYSSFIPSVPKISTPQVHGIEHTVQQVKVYNSLSGGMKPGGYEVKEQEDEGDDVFTSVNSLTQSYPGAYSYGSNVNVNAADQNNVFGDINFSNTNQLPSTNPYPIQQQHTYTNVEDFKFHNQPVEPIPNVQQQYSEQYSEYPGYENGDNSVIVTGPSGGSVQPFADVGQDDTPVTFSRETGIQHAINTGGIETVAY